MVWAGGMRILELNHAALHVADLESSRRFYREVVGLKEIPRPAFPFPGAWFRYGTTQELHLIVDDKIPTGQRGLGTHHALEVDDISAAQTHLESCGMKFRGPFTRPDGALQIFFQDPDGHTIELTANLPGR